MPVISNDENHPDVDIVSGRNNSPSIRVRISGSSGGVQVLGESGQPVFDAGPAGSDIDGLAVAAGLINWNYSPTFISSNVEAGGANSQRAAVTAVWLPQGAVISNIILGVTIAGSGTPPTGFYVGLTDGNTILAQSSNLASSSALTASGSMAFPLSATYTVPKSGIYYVIVLQNGSFGTTDVQFGRTAGSAYSQRSPNGTWLWGGIGSGLASLPTNGTAVTISGNGGQAYYFVGVS